MRIPDRLPYYSLLICVKGSATIDGQACKAGEAWFLPAQNETIMIEGAGSEWIIAYTADKPAA